MATEECHVHENYKQFLLKARDIDTRVTGRTTGHPVRTLRNPMTKEYLEKEAAGASSDPMADGLFAASNTAFLGNAKPDEEKLLAVSPARLVTENTPPTFFMGDIGGRTCSGSA